MPIRRRTETDREESADLQDENQELADAQVSIATRVKFWEKQHEINQVLIDRLIRQHRLLSEHIRNHDSLPEVADRAVRQALADARVEQQEQYRSIIEQLSATYRDTAQRLLAEERTEQRTHYGHALAAVDKKWQSDSRHDQRRLYVALGIVSMISIIALVMAIFATL